MILLQIPRDGLVSLGPHRTRAGWEICEDGQSLWLRLPPEAKEFAVALPCQARYRIDARQRLIPFHGTVPVAVAPAGPWRALHEFIDVSPALTLLPGRVIARMPITLSRSSREAEPAALLSTLTDLLSSAEEASRLRMAPLTFAAAVDGRVLVRGTLLPSVPGMACYLQGHLALPCGWEFAPPLWPGWVEQSLALPTGALALVEPDGHIEVMDQESFTPLSLAALRRTYAALSTVRA